jgi:hypothetical protein
LIASFSRKTPANIVILFIYAVVLKFSILGHLYAPMVNNSDGKLYKALTTYLKGSSLAPSLIVFVLLMLQAISIAQIMNRGRLMNKPNYLPAMGYLLITSFFIDWNVLSSALIANAIILLVWNLITQLQSAQNPKAILFNIGLLIGLCNFIYVFSFTFLLLAIIGLIVYRAFRLNEYLILLLGFTVPYYFLFVIEYLSDTFKIQNYKIYFSIHLPQFNNARWVLTGVLIIAVLTIVGIYFVQQQSNKMLVQARKSWSILFFYLCISLLIPFFSSNFGYWILCLLPAAAFIGAGFLYIKNQKIKSGLHWLLFSFAIYLNYFLSG